MAIIKSWIDEAANELASHLALGGFTNQRRQEVTNFYAGIIAKHCPFKEGFAYKKVDNIQSVKVKQIILDCNADPDHAATYLVCRSCLEKLLEVVR